MQVKKQSLEPCMEQLIGSVLRKDYDRAVCYHPICLIYMLSTSWTNAGLEVLQAEIKIVGRISNNLRYVDDTTLIAEGEEKLKSLLMRVKEERDRAGSKANV